MLLWRASLIALVLPFGGAWADAISPAADAVAVTIYHDDALSTANLLHPDATPWVMDEGLALISETRQIDLPAGPSQIRFRGVASTMVPQTATIDGLPAGTLERNFDYDLLSPGSLLAKSIGETVHLIRTDPKTGKTTDVPAIVRTGPNGAMLEVDGKLEALRCSGLPERLVFDRTPDGLTDTPTLTVRTDAPAAGRYTVKLTYLATGLNWSADYVARVHGRTLDLSGWLTLANFGSTGFGRIPIAAVAGHLNTTGDDKPVHAQALALATQCWPTDIDWATRRAILMDMAPPPPPPPAPMMAGVIETVVVSAERKAEQRQLGDYKLYQLPEPTDMPAHETKQVLFLDQTDVPFERLYRYRVSGESESGANPATLVLRLKNTAESGLGKPLPAGFVAVTEPGPGGAPIFIGQQAVRDTPIGLPVEIENGAVYSVLVSQTLADEKKTGSGDSQRVQRTFDFELANDRSETISFELWQDLYNGAARILSEPEPHAVDRGAAIWRIALKPGERRQMRIAVDSPY